MPELWGMHPKVRISILLFCFSLGFRSIGLGQTATLRGTVTDKFGCGLDSVRIEVPQANQFTFTDSKGNYVLHLPPGKYFVFFRNPWYKRTTEIRTFASSAEILLNVNLGERYALQEVEISEGDDPKDSPRIEEIGHQKLPIDPKRVTELSCWRRDSTTSQPKRSK